jgi:hypothetical protein
MLSHCDLKGKLAVVFKLQRHYHGHMDYPVLQTFHFKQTGLRKHFFSQIKDVCCIISYSRSKYKCKQPLFRKTNPVKKKLYNAPLAIASKQPYLYWALKTAKIV